MRLNLHIAEEFYSLENEMEERYDYKEETKKVAQQLPFTLSAHSKHILLKTMEADGSYLTILVNMKDENVSVDLKKNVNKKARLIFGGKLIDNANDSNILLAPQETVVILWK